MLLKHHNEVVGTALNQMRGFDRDFENIPGVSPLKRRHPYNLFGEKSGVAKFNPIMVDNVNPLPAKKDNKKPPAASKKKEESGAKGKKNSDMKNVLTDKKSDNNRSKQGSGGKNKSKLIPTNSKAPDAADNKFEAFDEFVPYSGWKD